MFNTPELAASSWTKMDSNGISEMRVLILMGNIENLTSSCAMGEKISYIVRIFNKVFIERSAP